MPAAAVIPAPLAYAIVVAVKTLIVGSTIENEGEILGNGRGGNFPLFLNDLFINGMIDTAVKS